MYKTYLVGMSQASSDPTVAANEVQRHWGEVADRALRHPIVITSKGRPRHVLMAYDEYQRLKARDRRAYRIEDLPDDLAAQVSAGLDELRYGVAEDGDTVIG